MANHPSPVLPHAALSDLESGLERILSGTLEGRGRFPMRVYLINADMEMLTWYFSEPGGPWFPVPQRFGTVTARATAGAFAGSW
jgi:hypothetical protein